MNVAKKTYSDKEYRYILILLLIGLGVLLFKELRPYLSGFLGALTLYALLRGQMKKMVNKWKWKKSLAALVIDLEALFIFLIPITVIIMISLDTFSSITIDVEGIKDWLFTQIRAIEDRFDIEILTSGKLSSLFTGDTLSSIPRVSGAILQAIASGSYSVMINLLVIVFVLYFMLVEFEEFEILLEEILPFRQENKRIFIQESIAIIRANAIGIPLLATVQGGLAYIGYLIFNVDNALLYAVLTAFSTIIPIIGTAIVYIPLAIVFLIEQKYGAALGLTAYGLLIIGTSDNVIRFILQKQLADIHPLITIFGVLIGIPMFGFWGVVFGPLLLSLFMLFLNMYRHDYVPGSNATIRITSEYNKKDLSKIKGLKDNRIRELKDNTPFFKKKMKIKFKKRKSDKK